MGMGKGNQLSDSAWAKFVELWRWYQRVKHLIKPQQRRRQIISAGGGSGEIRRAKCTAAAGTGVTIEANLFHPTTGVEQTTGDESAITVYCNMSPYTTANLSDGSRLLGIGDNIFVTKSVYDNSGTPVTRWYEVGGFDVFEECVCTEPA